MLPLQQPLQPREAAAVPLPRRPLGARPCPLALHPTPRAPLRPLSPRPWLAKGVLPLALCCRHRVPGVQVGAALLGVTSPQPWCWLRRRTRASQVPVAFRPPAPSWPLPPPVKPNSGSRLLYQMAMVPTPSMGSNHQALPRQPRLLVALPPASGRPCSPRRCQLWLGAPALLLTLPPSVAHPLCCCQPPHPAAVLRDRGPLLPPRRCTSMGMEGIQRLHRHPSPCLARGLGPTATPLGFPQACTPRHRALPSRCSSGCHPQLRTSVRLRQ